MSEPIDVADSDDRREIRKAKDNEPMSPADEAAIDDETFEILEEAKRRRIVRKDCFAFAECFMMHNLDHLRECEREQLQRLLKASVNFLVQTTFEA